MKQLRVLSVTPAFSVCGGIESYSMNYYRHMGDDIRMDFMTHDYPDEELYYEVTDRGDGVFVMPPFSPALMPETLGRLRAFFKKHGDKYDIIHCNMANAACFYFPYAKRAGISTRIIHSHQDRAADTLSHSIRNIPLLNIGERMATHRLACTSKAGDFLYRDHPYTLIKNAIETDRYRFSDEKRASFRRQYDIGDARVIGTIGRLTEQKNHDRLIDIFAALSGTCDDDYRLVIVGDGHLFERLKQKAVSLRLADRIIFTGPIPDVAPALCAFDYFLLPSLYEGLGIVNIEAQACGLPTIASDVVPSDADMGALYSAVSLDADDLTWASHIQKISPRTGRERYDISNINAIKAHGYDIASEAEKLVEYYHRAASF